MKYSLLTRLSAAMLLSSFVAACTDEVPPIPTSELYTREFVKRFGVVDKAHTWNASTQASVDVTTDRESRIMVSGIINGKRYLLADYEGVKGSRKLKFDMPLGYKDIRVTDGYEDIYTTVGSKVNFASGSRVIYDRPDGDVVKVNRTEDYRILSDEAVRSFGHYLPEDKVNLGKVVQNFTFISEGPFTIYPVFWQTNAYLTLGVYYEIDELDENGKKKVVHVPFYTNKILREGETDSNLQFIRNTEYAALPEEWIVPTGDVVIHPYQFANYGVNKWNSADLTEEEIAIVKAGFVKENENKDVPGADRGVSMLPEEMKKQRLLDNIEVEVRPGDDKMYVTRLHYTAVEGMTVEGKWTNSLDQCSYINDDFYKAYIAAMDKGMTEEEALAAAESKTNQKRPTSWRSRGITVDIKPGTKFGMYLRHETSAPNPDNVDIVVGKDGKTRFYSNAERNENYADENGVEKPLAHAATYLYTAPSGIQYRVLGFEDWYNYIQGTSNSSDRDLNDMMFFIDGEIPQVKDEDPGEELEWLVACEDLGALDDFDFNDVVFQVRHVAGREMAYITPLAAGGTLETYLHYIDHNGEDQVLAGLEWHEHFGVYNHSIMLNTQGGITHKARERGILVGTDFTLSPVLHDAGGNLLGTAELKKNMGGLHVSVVRADGTREDITPPTRTGEAPQMFLIPQIRKHNKADGTPVDDKNFSYKWFWPIERHAIEKAYPDFKNWIKDSSTFTDWHTEPNMDHVVKR